MRLFALGVLVLFAMVVIRTAWVCDDAYITLRTVDNLLHGLGLRWNPAERVQSYTHPLWMFLLAGAVLITRETFFATMLLSIGCTVATAILLVRRVAPSGPAAMVGLVLLLCSKAFIDYSTSGLENPLLHLVLVVFWILWLDGELDTRRLFRLSLVAALGMLTRLDAVLLFLPALGVGLVQSRRWSSVLAVAKGMLPLAAWELFSLVYYGFLFPNTAYAKLHTGLPAGELAHQGALYLLNSVGVDPITPLAIALGIAVPFIGAAKRDVRRLAIILGVVLYLLYTVKIGGDFMSGRFLAAPFLGAVVLILRSPLLEEAKLTLGLAGGLLFVFTLSPHAPVRIDTDHEERTHASDASYKAFHSRGISDERAYYYPTCSLLGATRASKRPDHIWVKEGRELGMSDVHVHASENVGFIGYYAGPGVHLVDTNALADPLLARLPPARNPHWRPGHYLRGLPEGYLETLKTGQNVIADGDLARYWDDLALVTRGPIFSAARWRAIWRLNSGANDGLIDRGRYLYPNVKRVALADLSTRRTKGSPWNAVGHLVISRAGGILHVSLPAPSHAPRLELSTDHNDTYQLLFLQAGAEVGSIEVGPQPGAGMAIHVAAVPPAAREAGYDEIRVRPTGGDGSYSVGHVVLVDP